jgi:hypothetical protein
LTDVERCATMERMSERRGSATMIRVTAEERANWMNAADLDGRSVSDWVRRVVNDSLDPANQDTGVERGGFGVKRKRVSLPPIDVAAPRRMTRVLPVGLRRR